MLCVVVGFSVVVIHEVYSIESIPNSRDRLGQILPAAIVNDARPLPKRHENTSFGDCVEAEIDCCGRRRHVQLAIPSHLTSVGCLQGFPSALSLVPETLICLGSGKT